MYSKIEKPCHISIKQPSKPQFFKYQPYSCTLRKVIRVGGILVRSMAAILAYLTLYRGSDFVQFLICEKDVFLAVNSVGIGCVAIFSGFGLIFHGTGGL